MYFLLSVCTATATDQKSPTSSFLFHCAFVCILSFTRKSAVSTKLSPLHFFSKWSILSFYCRRHFSLCETITMFGIIHSEFSLSYVCVCVWMMCLCWCCIYADNSIYYNNMVFTWKQLLVSQRFDDNARRLWWVVWKCFCVNWNRVCGSGNCGMMVCDVWIGFTKPVWPYCVYVILVHTHHENDDLDTVRLSIWALHNIVLYWMCICEMHRPRAIKMV